jgi:acetyl esterase/lipase
MNDRMIFGRWIRAALVVLTFATPALGQSLVTVTADVVYGHKDGMALTFDVFTPPRPNGAAVVHIVSGGWISRWTPPTQVPAAAQSLYTQLFEKGFTVFAVRHGSSPKYVIPEIVPDVRRAVRFIRMTAPQYGIDPARIGVTGMSAGGHLSLMIGLASDAGDPKNEDSVLRVSDRVAAVVAYYPPVDLDPSARAVATERPSTRFPALNFDAASVTAVSPIRHVSADDPPTLLIHGNKDELVPIGQSEQIYAAFQQNKVTSQFIVIEGGGHGFRGADADRANKATAEWFAQHLTKPAESSSQRRQ